MKQLNNYIIEKLRIGKNTTSNVGKEKDTKVRISKDYSKKDYLNDAREDYIDPNNHLEIPFPKSAAVVGWSIESLLNCNFKERIDNYDIRKLLSSVSDKKINGKLLPKYSSSRDFKFDLLPRLKNLFKEYWDISYLQGINLRSKNPSIFYVSNLMDMKYFTNLEGYGVDKNYNSDGVQELINFVDKNYKYEDKENNITMKIAFWNDRFSIFKFEIEDTDKFILTFCTYFARMNNTSDENNKFYYKN